PYKLLEHLRLRAGFDFLLLRCQSGELDAEVGEWWEAFIAGNGAEREELIARKPADTASAQGPKKRKRRGGRSRSKSGAAGAEFDAASDAVAAPSPDPAPVAEAGTDTGTGEAPKRRRRRRSSDTGEGSTGGTAPAGDAND
ncbi:MAG: polynucleotide adenylyltransferase PcnB, partial [Herbaspirillum sp.]|nr:polynucleotide adenylyltransferase PcnB [Herbaspirillum sp.]